MKEKFLKGLKWLFNSYIWLAVLLLIIDIITKRLIIHFGVTPDTQIADWGFVRINYILNYNAAFGLGTSNETLSRILYLVIASAIVIGLIIYISLKYKTIKPYVKACLMLVIAGAIGNMIDRIFYAPYHAVVDWIDFYWFWDYNFNIADCCIVISAFMLLFYVIVIEVKELIAKRNKELAEEKVQEEAKKDENKE